MLFQMYVEIPFYSTSELIESVCVIKDLGYKGENVTFALMISYLSTYIVIFF